jgi:hypothetical protein
MFNELFSLKNVFVEIHGILSGINIVVPAINLRAYVMCYRYFDFK